MSVQKRWLSVMAFACIGFVIAQYSPSLTRGFRSKLDTAARTAFASVFLRNAPSCSALHGHGSMHAYFVVYLGLALFGAALIPVTVAEDPLTDVAITVLNISMIIWSLGLFSGISKGLGAGFMKGARIVVCVRVCTVVGRGLIFAGMMATQWRLSTIHPAHSEWQGMMVVLQHLALITTFMETHALTDMLTRSNGNEKPDSPVEEVFELL